MYQKNEKAQKMQNIKIANVREMNPGMLKVLIIM
jgi:hypothetical protein